MGLRLPPMLARLSTLLRPATGSSQEPSRGLESAGQPPGRHPSRLPPPPSALSRRGGLASLGSRRLMWRLEPARPPPLDFLGSWDVFQNPHTLVRDVGGTYGDMQGGPGSPFQNPHTFVRDVGGTYGDMQGGAGSPFQN